MEDIMGETELPVSFLPPQAAPAVLRPSQQISDTASTSKTTKKDGGGLEISVK